MSHQVIVHKGRTNSITVDLGQNYGSDVFTSEIRSEPDTTSALIATWVVTSAGTGKLLLTLDDVATKDIEANAGYMDLKRVSGGEPLPVFDRPLEVIFRGTVTA